ncbi:hypothetical protein MJO29_013566 [Puccinia striiformis f. sp. tritici]|nr:hypothetical protein MJO29_013566 [Puccinia striiformis f. sp. tritici]
MTHVASTPQGGPTSAVNTSRGEASQKFWRGCASPANRRSPRGVNGLRNLWCNHGWAIDGHDKLKPFGITVYGFIDAWSRKILGLFVHVTNNDPKHIGVYYLKLVLRLGGIPLKVTADYGTETCDVSTYQMMLSHRFGGITLEETTKRMHHTKSTHNQKIECLWSQMMRQHNRSIINHLMDRVNDHSHNMQDPIQKLLFLFLWIPVFQSSANIWVDLNNHARKRKDKTISLPTGCTPDFSYSTPEAFHTVDQLVPVDTEYIQRLLHDNYPNIDDMFTHTPPWFHSIASSIMHDLGSHFAFFPPPSYDVVKIESDDDDDEPNTL